MPGSALLSRWTTSKPTAYGDVVADGGQDLEGAAWQMTGE
jgi:hypothetical protein